METEQKSRELLSFLKGFAALRRKSIPRYRQEDKVLWMADFPEDLPTTWSDACRSVFSVKKQDELQDIWIEVRKRKKPELPTIPEEIIDWLPEFFLYEPEKYIDKDTEKMLGSLKEKIHVPAKMSAHNVNTKTMTESEDEEYLKDHPEIEEAWLDYLINQWEPWIKEMHYYNEVKQIYDALDFMRQRLEEAEERYELVFGIGLLQWSDPSDVIIKRHILTAAAEIEQDATRGVLKVTPAASFNRFKIELDMLALQYQPDLSSVNEEIEKRLDELDVRIWDKNSIEEILQIIANKAGSNAWVDMEKWKPIDRVGNTINIIFAPALILRERRDTAYGELINNFIKSADERPDWMTKPWEQFVSEGDIPDSADEDIQGNDVFKNNGDDRLYFTLQTNEEQKKIAERLKAKPYVLVKGPPGTGKSHTIANLICHLLASGERILVTAQAPKALSVLRDLLPGDIPNLCVMAFGSTREDQKLLEDSIRRIISRKSEWNNLESQQEIDRLDEELTELEKRRAKIDSQLRQCREAEIYSQTLYGGYQGTAAQIARKLEAEKESYDWFPDAVNPDSRCPLQAVELEFLAEVHCSLTEEYLNELNLHVGDFTLPDPESFRKSMESLSYTEKRMQVLCEGIEPKDLDRLSQYQDTELEQCKELLNSLEREIIKANNMLGSFSEEVFKDLLLEQDMRWQKLLQNIDPILEQIRITSKKLGTARIELTKEVQQSKLLTDARRRYEHFKNNGSRGFGFLAPQVVRETNYIEKQCLVNGNVPKEADSLETLVTFLELEEFIRQFFEACPELYDLQNRNDLSGTVQTIEESVEELRSIIGMFAEERHVLTIIPLYQRASLVNLEELHKQIAIFEAETARRSAKQAKEIIDEWLRNIRSLTEDSLHPCMKALAEAIEKQDIIKWQKAWDEREHFKVQRERYNRYLEQVNLLDENCPGIKVLLNNSSGNSKWKDRILNLDKAWAWASACVWLRQMTDKNNYSLLMEQRKEVEKKIEEKILRLAEIKAWKSFFDRLDDKTQQSLIAWQKAMSRVGKGTGKYASKHRRAASRYLQDCIPKIPAWIMPLHKLWDTVTAQVGMFDTIIVDEASQAGIDSLILFQLGKRLVVVGDDKQNSPEAVGVLEDDITHLSKEHLRDFRYREEFRPDTSLYDHAERAIGNVISLREHFRCAPEIIRFSNDLCYTDQPLIPLRQMPPERLTPLKATFVPEGFCEGDGPYLINRSEVDKIVNTIQMCIDDEAYRGKTMGVIVLQGNAQAELIERKLAEILEPAEREERKIRCGIPATFQGDQRDVIFLSLVVAGNHSYRALTNLQEQRRFNVAMSRARDQVWLFHSVEQHDLSREDLRWRLLNHFYSNVNGMSEESYEEKERLERETARKVRSLGNQPEPYESWFEVDVALELLRRGYRVRPQYKVSGYRIDLVIEGLESRLAVECDGDVWHGPEQYDHDMARQRQLERAGWTFVRVRESEFYADRKEALRLIEEECRKLKII